VQFGDGGPFVDESEWLQADDLWPLLRANELAWSGRRKRLSYRPFDTVVAVIVRSDKIIARV
jgi:hypothetical protein